MNMIDVHILHLPHENKQWADECLHSLRDEPINVHHLNGILGDLRPGRNLGYQQGTAPYVSFVDPDDMVYPGAFQQCLDVLENNPECCGVYTMSDIEFEDGQKHINHPYREWTPEIQHNNILEIHQIVVMRRDLILKCYVDYYDEMPRTAYHEMYSFMRLAMNNPWIAVDCIGYMWRQRTTGCHYIEGLKGLPPSVVSLRHQFRTLHQIT